jgi:hypothetical protein
MNDTSKVSSISTRTDDDDMINPSLQPTTPVTIVQSTLSDLDILKYILSFVGWNQYRFVASVNHTFYDAYLHLFPRNKFTYYTASSIRQAMICYQESNASSNRWAQCVLCASAAQYGSLITLQYLRSSSFSDADDEGKEDDEEISCHWDSRTCAMAAKYGHLHVLQWARTNHCPWNSATCAYAAEQGHSEIVQWAHINGCSWDSETCKNAAKNGHLEILQYAHTHGCPWNIRTCAYAAINGHVHVLQYARSHGCPWDTEKVVEILKSSNCRHPRMIQWVQCNM